VWTTADVKKNRSNNSHLDEHWFFGAERMAQNGFKRVRTVDAASLISMTCCEGDKVERRQLGRERMRQPKIHAEFFQCLVSTVPDDDEGYGQLKLASGPQAWMAYMLEPSPISPITFCPGFPSATPTAAGIPNPRPPLLQV
jgi:hypothetical protein